jgi:hypothetical protein
MEELVTLRTFNTLEEASAVVELLEKNKIHYLVEKTEVPIEVVLPGENLDTELLVKVKPEAFEAAKTLLEELEEIGIEKLDKDYYLFDFTDQELIELLQKSDEWSLKDYLWAQEILKQRGKEVDKSLLNEWNDKRLAFLATPEKVTPKYLMLAYLFCFAGGWIGFFMGRHVRAFKKLLPNNQKVFAFDEESRVKGKKIESIGLIFSLVYMIVIGYFLFES